VDQLTSLSYDDVLDVLISNKTNIVIGISGYYIAKILFNNLRIRYYFWKRGIRTFEGTRCIPLLGHGPFWPTDFAENFKVLSEGLKKHQELYPKEGDCVVHSLPTLAFHMRYTAESAAEVFKDKRYNSKSWEYDLFYPLFGKGLVCKNKTEHKKARKMLTPFFHGKVLKNYELGANEKCEIMVKNIEKYSKTNDVTEMLHFTGLCGLDMIFQSAIGVSAGVQENADHSYVKAVEYMAPRVTSRIFFPWLWSEIGFRLFGDGAEAHKNMKFMRDYTKKIITKKLQANNENDGIISMVDMLLDKYKNREIDFQEVLDECDTFIYAGHDTTAISVSALIWNFGHHPKYQELVFNEIMEKYPDRNTPMTDDCLNNLKWLNLCIKESLRTLPPILWVFRNYHKGINEFISIFSINNNKNVWGEDVDVFRPERMMKDIHQYEYIPFSAGARNCIGQNLAYINARLMAAHLIRNFEFRSVHTRNELKLAQGLTLKAEKGWQVRISKRLDKIE